ncbi:MAG: hypothetical protein R6U84_07850 [Candidatus Cloacimonadales bacterium]
MNNKNSKTSMHRVILALALLIVIPNLGAYSLLDYETGNKVAAIDARTAAMGDAATGGSQNFFSSQQNPANLANLTGKFGFQFSSGFMRTQQQRSLPMYDSFDSFVGDAEYVHNEDIFSEIAVGGFYKMQLHPLEIILATSYRPFINFDCQYDEEIRNNSNSDFNSYPPIIAQNQIRGAGSLNGVSFQTALAYERYTLGLEVTKLMGEQSYARKVLWSEYAVNAAPPGDDSLQDSVWEVERDFDGLTYQIGLQAEIDKYTSVGMSFVPQMDIDAEYADTTMSFEQPGKFRVGILHSPRSFISTSLNLDVELVSWNELNQLYDNELNYYLGVEHIINQKLPFRLGFNYQTTYQMIQDSGIEYANKIVMPTITTGTGVKILDNFNLDFSLAFSHRIYEALDLFPDSFYDHEYLWENYTYMNLQDRGWENPDKVTDTFIKFQTTLSYKF